jgi:hypothetical protein
VLDQRAPRGIQMDQVPAKRKLLEYEAMQTIAVTHVEGPRAS